MYLSKKASIFVYRLTLFFRSRNPWASFGSITTTSGFLPTAAIFSTRKCRFLIGTRTSFSPCTSITGIFSLATP